MKRILSFIIAITMLACSMTVFAADNTNKILAFPGAEGPAKYAKGGRTRSNTQVYHVTNLNADGEGSLADAVSQSGRIIVFDVGGTIHLKKPLHIDGVTILGQTAPGDGITIADANVDVNSSSIIRYLRVRLGIVNGLESDTFGGTAWESIIDHCSASYSVDECMTFYKTGNTTVQNCIISESLKNSIHSKGAHGYGGIWGGTNSGYYHNLMASHDSRTPRLDREIQGTDVRNNIIYNWGQTNSAYGAESVTYDGEYIDITSTVNWINNYYKPGPGTAAKLKNRIFDISSTEDAPSKMYFAGNYMVGDAAVTADNTKGIRIASGKGVEFLSEPVEMTYTIPEETAEETYAALLSHVGASLPRRDETDARIVDDVINGTGRIIDAVEEVGGITDYPAVYRKFEIPQEWKDQHGMGDHGEGDIIESGEYAGYTWIEAYVNEWTEQQTAPTNPHVVVSEPAIPSLSSSIRGISVKQGTVTNTDENGFLHYKATPIAEEGTAITKTEIYDGATLLRTVLGDSGVDDDLKLTNGTHFISCRVYNDKGEMTQSPAAKVVAAAAETGLYLTGAALEDNKAVLTIDNQTGARQTVTIYIGVYDSDGNLESCTSSKIAAPTVPITTRRDVTYGADSTVKVYLWNDGLQPLTEGVTLKK